MYPYSETFIAKRTAFLYFELVVATKSVWLYYYWTECHGRKVYMLFLLEDRIVCFSETYTWSRQFISIKLLVRVADNGTQPNSNQTFFHSTDHNPNKLFLRAADNRTNPTAIRHFLDQSNYYKQIKSSCQMSSVFSISPTDSQI